MAAAIERKWEQRMAASSERNSIRDTAELEDLLSEPTEAVIQALGTLQGDIVVLGVGGKMGPTLARMAKRASELSGTSRPVTGVSRFSSAKLQQRLEAWGIATLSCDLLDRESLPDAPNVVYTAGMN